MKCATCGCQFSHEGGYRPRRDEILPDALRERLGAVAYCPKCGDLADNKAGRGTTIYHCHLCCVRWSLRALWSKAEELHELKQEASR